ncbi:nitrophenyl compound nitroreductase subunit ArsF family protein [Methanomethylovorans sp.]|uniref:nitrophenyl compound nitroreductase subunit ArsF family protein n=1 Tax=Methanomethylovorans sp. TaxID=2758717 RepID=UPI00351C9C05
MNRLLIVILVLTLFSAGCVGNNAEGTTKVVDGNLRELPHIEVIHFHGNNQCYSCQVVGAYAEETVNTYFPDELDSGNLVFRHVNFDLPEDKELTQRYGAAYSSLWIGTYTEKGFSAEQDTNVWYKVEDRNSYMSYLSEVINEKLAGL